ncbi:MAG: EAL domain-containing protein [Herminiimonas sp.]|nr:EAL domain-containing protein [Herminiimonas sp.]
MATADTKQLRRAALHEYGIDCIDDASALDALLKVASELSGALRQLIESERRMKEAQEIAGLGAYNLTAGAYIRSGSAITNSILGLPAELTSLSATDYNRMIHPDDLPRLLSEREHASRTGEPIESTYRIIRRSDGAVRWIKSRGVQIRDDSGDVVRQSGVLQDITALREAERALRLNQRAVEASSNGILIVDAQVPDLPIIYVNRAFETLTGYSQAEILGQNCRFLQGDESDQAGLRNLRQALQSQQDGHALLRNYRKDGTLFWVDLHVSPVRDEQGTVTHYVGFQTDCTERIRYQDELRYQAGHDSLTGLANRSLLQDRIDQALLRSRPGEQLAVVFIDLDRFKLINDSMGHGAGDLLLKECALRIGAKVDAEDTIARMGGDEFVVLLHQVAGPESVQQQIDAILVALNAPFYIDGNTITISASAGIALYPAHGETTSALLRNADIAMYDAKSHGRDNSRLFSTDLSERAVDSLRLKTELIVALAERQFCLHYQPKIDAGSGELVGFEALVRWNHPVRGLLYPGSFIDAAEDFGLINELGSWVMREACRQAKAWHLAGSHMVSVAVNVSAAQFRNQAFLVEVEHTLAHTGLAAGFLELEITESLVMESPQQFIQILSQLHGMGVTISVDDFGTGYSSLSFVKQFPIDFLKIDKSFVNDISTDPSDAAICETIITMGHNLGLLVIAEGVETIEQALFLRAHGCDILQGYLISRPLAPDSDFGVYPRLLQDEISVDYQG